MKNKIDIIIINKNKIDINIMKKKNNNNFHIFMNYIKSLHPEIYIAVTILVQRIHTQSTVRDYFPIGGHLVTGT